MADSGKRARKRYAELAGGMQLKLDRQKRAIDRLVAANTTSMAALMEIAHEGGSEDYLRTLARKAIDDLSLLLSPAAAEEQLQQVLEGKSDAAEEATDE